MMPQSPPIAPPPPPIQDIPVKTPRPDVTVGLCHSTVVNALVARGLGEVKASDFLYTLQSQRVICSDTAKQGLIRFPPLVVEGKSYATGMTVFEAQNQAAVSGSCMTNLQHKLSRLAERASPRPYHSKVPLAFSICTEGPHMGTLHYVGGGHPHVQNEHIENLSRVPSGRGCGISHGGG